MTREPLRFTAPEGFTAPHRLGCDCRDCRLRRDHATPPATGGPTRPRTPEDGQRIHTPEGGQPVTTRED